MSRFNVFYMIHKGLRALMYDVSLSLQLTDFAQADGYPHSLEKLIHLVEVFDAHAGHEDNYMFPLLEACNPALQAEMEQEHVTDIALSHELRALTDAYKAATDAAEKGAIGYNICKAFNAYIAFNLTHMNKEETVVNESLWANYTDQEIAGANMRMIAGMAPDEVKRNAIWMLRGCSNTDIIGWLGMVKKQTPPPVIQLLMGLAEQELPQDRFEVVQGTVMADA